MRLKASQQLLPSPRQRVHFPRLSHRFGDANEFHQKRGVKFNILLFQASIEYA